MPNFIDISKPKDGYTDCQRGLMAEDHELEITAITRMQRMKTGNLIAYSCEAGAVAARASKIAPV